MSITPIQIIMAEVAYGLASIFVTQAIWKRVKKQGSGKPGPLGVLFKQGMGPVIFYLLGFLGGALTILLFTTCP